MLSLAEGPLGPNGLQRQEGKPTTSAVPGAGFVQAGSWAATDPQGGWPGALGSFYTLRQAELRAQVKASSLPPIPHHPNSLCRFTGGQGVQEEECGLRSSLGSSERCRFFSPLANWWWKLCIGPKDHKGKLTWNYKVTKLQRNANCCFLPHS